jgi:hypothetical protein
MTVGARCCVSSYLYGKRIAWTNRHGNDFHRFLLTCEVQAVFETVDKVEQNSPLII